MYRGISTFLWLVAVLALLSVVGVGYYVSTGGSATLSPSVSGGAVSSHPVASVRNGDVPSSVVSEVMQLPAEKLSPEEINGILWMREEEKLARDVYLTLYKKWGIPIFRNIAESEQTHTDAVKAIIDKYGLKDPVESNAIGAFTNPEIRALYEKLVAEGSKSVVDALKVGATIEEMDIIDLQHWLSKTDNKDVRLVYCNLMKGSRNHLRAFVSQLSRYGVKYTPQYLSESEFNAIISGSTERGLLNC